MTVLAGGLGPLTASVTGPQGTMVVWMFASPGTHSATDNSGMGLFDSGLHSAVSYSAFRFVGAGTYSYVDTADSAVGTVKVPLKVSQTAGTTATTFTVAWGAAGHRPGSCSTCRSSGPEAAST